MDFFDWIDESGIYLPQTVGVLMSQPVISLKEDVNYVNKYFKAFLGVYQHHSKETELNASDEYVLHFLISHGYSNKKGKTLKLPIPHNAAYQTDSQGLLGVDCGRFQLEFGQTEHFIQSVCEYIACLATPVNIKR